MRTFQRLMRAYEGAKILEFDEHSKYVFISDCHRGNGSFSDEFSKNRNTYIHALNYYNDRGFTYIEVGDGDEFWEVKKMSIIQEAHTDALHAMKRFHDDGRFVYIYGNHNIMMRDEAFVREHYYQYYNEFTEQDTPLLPGLQPVEAVRLVHKHTGQEIFVVHGHQGDAGNDQFWRISMLSLRYFWRYLHSFGIKNPASPVKNIFKRHKIEKNYAKWIATNRKALICGHTHRFKYPRTGELPYFNTGSCVYPTTITSLELEHGLISLIRWKVLVNAEGVIQVQRMVLKGPRRIEDFDMRDVSERRVENAFERAKVEIKTSGETVEGGKVEPE